MVRLRYVRSVIVLIVASSVATLFFHSLTAFNTLIKENSELHNVLHTIDKKETCEAKEPKLWFDPETPYDDRIINQMNHIPKAYKLSLEKGIPPKKISILKYNGLKNKMYGAFLNPNGNPFENCSVDRCELTGDRSRMSTVDAIIFEYEHPKRTPDIFPTEQIWIMYKIEGPFVSHGVMPGDKFNWTATYRPDSTLPNPHYKFVKEPSPSTPKRFLTNFAKGKTKKVAWFVSNCNTTNKRMEYARELQKYISLDIYGKCGNYSCKMWGRECFNTLQRDYKFYLAFENANCRHYITEKLVRNALMTNTLPIVMGPPKEDYEHRAPANSFIHVDDFKSPRDLAQYLHVLDKNDRRYSSYFQWKWSGYFMGAQTSRFWCRLCAMLHEQRSNPRPPTWYKDTNKWWRGEGICIGNDKWWNHFL